MFKGARQLTGLYFCLLVSILGTGCSLAPQLEAIRAQLRVLPKPAVQSASTSVAFTGGGGLLTIQGTNFTAGSKVLVDGSECLQTGSFSTTQIQCQMPAHAAGAVKVSVVNTEGQSSDLPQTITYSTDGFTRLEIIAGNAYTTGSADGVGKAARLNGAGMMVRVGDYLYFGEIGNSVIRKMNVQTQEIASISGFNDPEGLASDGTSLYVADRFDHVIRKVDIASGTVTLYAGEVGTNDYVDDANPLNARFNCPEGIAYVNGTLYVADSSNYVIRAIDTSSGAVTTLAGDQTTSTTADGIGAAATFTDPWGLTYLNGALYITDYDDGVIRKLNLADTSVTTIAGDPSNSMDTLDGVGSAAGFDEPSSVTSDGTYLYVSEVGGYAVRKINLATTAVTTILESFGDPTTAGPLSTAQIQTPNGILFDSTYGLFVATERTLTRIH